MIKQNPRRFRTFDSVVRDICAYLDDPSATKKYIKVARGLKIALDELNLHSYPMVKSEKIIVLDNFTAPLPEDAISVSKVGYCCDDGCGNKVIRQLVQDNDLCLPENESFYKCCECTKVTDDNGLVDEEKSEFCEKCTFHNYVDLNKPYGIEYNTYWFGYKYDMYWAGAYRVDERNNQLVLASGCQVDVGSELVVEYQAINGEEEYQMIPAEAYTTLQHYTAFWCNSNARPQVAQYEMRNFRIHRRLLKAKKLNYTLEQIVESLRSGYRSSPKR